ncbi:hypothetical protein [Promicromonospora sp. NPDC090134]|uniref:hypothetical protein n=1 Tax=Promicromonospora sp. NPDC090134 TaxID=3364408 RepID=UPI00382E926F
MTDLDDEPARDDGTRATGARRRAIRTARTSLLVGVLAALAALGVSLGLGRGDLLLVASLGGGTLTFLLWTVSCASGVVLSMTGFRLFVIGYEAFTAAMAALFLCAFVLFAVIATLFTGLMTLLSAETRYVVLGELDRPADQRIVVGESFAVHHIHWRVYQGGPFHYRDITESLLTDPDCHELGADRGLTPFARGDYTLTTDAQGRDVLSFAADEPLCDNDGTYDLVLPD